LEKVVLFWKTILSAYEYLVIQKHTQGHSSSKSSCRKCTVCSPYNQNPQN